MCFLINLFFSVFFRPANFDDSGSFSKLTRLIVIINLKASKHELIFLCRVSILEYFFSLLPAFSSLIDKQPESSVIEVIDVAVGLSPRKVVSKIFKSWILYNSSVKHGNFLQFLTFKKFRKVKNVAGGEAAGNDGDYFI